MPLYNELTERIIKLEAENKRLRQELLQYQNFLHCCNEPMELDWFKDEYRWHCRACNNWVSNESI